VFGGLLPPKTDMEWKAGRIATSKMDREGKGEP